MISRWKVIFRENGNLKAKWINFLGLFIYYINNIDVHHHIYYNSKFGYCYTLNTKGTVLQHFGYTCAINTNGVPVDKCIMCNIINA